MSLQTELSSREQLATLSLITISLLNKKLVSKLYKFLDIHKMLINIFKTLIKRSKEEILF